MRSLASALLVLLSSKDVHSQSQEPSPYDTNVAAGCTATSTTAPSATSVTLTQLSGTTARANWGGGNGLYAYLLDQDGTVLDYLDGVNSEASFDFGKARWGETMPYPGVPTKLEAVVAFTNCKTMAGYTATWAGMAALKTQEYDVSNSQTGTPTGTAPTLTTTIGNNWFAQGGTATVGFQGGAGSVMAWVEADGTVVWLQDTEADGAAGGQNANFPAHTLTVTACELYETGKFCTSENLASKYVANLGAGATVGYATTFSAGQSPSKTNTLKPCGTANAGCTLTGCTSYFIYATAAGGALAAAGFTGTLNWKQDLTSYTAYVYCGADLKQATIATSDLPAEALSIGAPEKIVAPPECTVSETTGASGTSFLLDDGRNCTCVKGDAFCTAKDPQSIFRLSDGEAVGLALSVSIIVMLLLMAAIFLCLKKSAQKQELVGVLKSNTHGGEVPQDDRL